MKKLLRVFVLGLLLFPFVSSASTVSLDSRGCAEGYNFSVTTGKSCSAPIVLRDCGAGDLFSMSTGRPCNVANTQQPQTLVFQNTPPVINNSSLVQEYNSKLQDLQQQILDIKTQYYTKEAAIDSSAIALEDINARVQKLLNDSNENISKIQLQEQQLYLDYQNKLNMNNQTQINIGQNNTTSSNDIINCHFNSNHAPAICFGVGSASA